MEIVVRGRQIEVSDRFREHVNERLERLEHHGFILQRIDVEVTKERNPRLADQAIRVELTCLARGDIIRAEYAAADKVGRLRRCRGPARRAAQAKRGATAAPGARQRPASAPRARFGTAAGRSGAGCGGAERRAGRMRA